MPIVIFEKKCARCGVTKAADQFYDKNNGLDRKRRYCKECDLAIGMNKSAQRRRTKGPVPDGHQCPICDRVTLDWHLDHDHQTGTIRDYLCRGCNQNMDRYTGDHWLAPATTAYLVRHASPLVCELVEA